MVCYTCSKLMSAYDAAVKLYVEASYHLTGIIGDDFVRAFDECETLRLSCQEANRILLAHICSDHSISRQRN